MYKITLLLALIPSILFATIDDLRHEKIKKINREFSVSKNANLQLFNKYGNVTITSWNENKIAIEVVITVKGNDLDRVENRIENIQVEFKASSDKVFAKTILESGEKNWNWWKKSDNLNYKIDYFVKMPKSNSLDLKNEYGSIFLDALSGNTNIQCDYGKIILGELLGENNTINLDYCSSSTISYIKNGILNLDYSKLTIENSEKIKSNSDYTTLEINKVQEINFNAGYGSLKVEDAATIIGRSDYTGLRFGSVSKKLQIDTDYGSIFVKDLKKNFESVFINGEFTTIKIAVDPNADFDIRLDLEYTGFKDNNDKISFQTRIEKSTKKYYEGKFGKGNSNSKLDVKSQYGSVSINEN
ncbi:hypothetical protein [Polaribacter sp.]|uniref:hypothetical protein n=1 Tax=Polaribacter sp. TaxID=1920175 RepID=UPI004047927B